MKKIFKSNPISEYLFNINLIYANITYVSAMRKKEKFKKDPEILIKSLKNRILFFMPLFMFFIYTLIFLPFDFSKFPYLLDVSIAFFIVLNLLQTFTYFYNVFYESKDVENYMSMPISEKDVFKSKLVVVTISTIQLLVPIISMYLIYYFRSGYGLIAIVFAVFDFLLSLGIVIAINMVFIQLLAKSAVLSKMRNKIVTIISAIAMIMNVAFILLFQNYSYDLSQKAVASKVKIYGPLTEIYKSNLKHFLLIVILFVILYLIYKFIMSNINGKFYSYLQSLQSTDFTNNKKHKDFKNSIQGKNKDKNIMAKTKDFDIRGFMKARSNFKNLFEYNKSLVSDSKVINQSIISGGILPIVMIIPVVINLSKMKLDLLSDINQLLISFSIAFALGILNNINSISLPAIMISLDRENYDYIKSLPVDMRKYLLNKYIISSTVSLIFGVIAIVGAFMFLKINSIYIILALFIFIIVSMSMAGNWIIYDYKHTWTQWQNISDLASRVNKSITMLLMFVVIFFIIMMVSILYFIADFGLQGIAIGILITLILLISSISVIRFIKFLKRI